MTATLAFLNFYRPIEASKEIHRVLRNEGHLLVGGRTSDNIAQVYTEMVVEDKRLKLAGYDVYRFGGYEFTQSDKAVEAVRAFFSALFGRYSVAA